MNLLKTTIVIRFVLFASNKNFSFKFLNFSKSFKIIMPKKNNNINKKNKYLEDKINQMAESEEVEITIENSTMKNETMTEEII